MAVERRKNITAEEELANIYMAMRRVTLSKRQASIIVGGRYALERLVNDDKKISKTQTHNRQNSQWKCNGEDVLRCAKDNFVEV